MTGDLFSGTTGQDSPQKGTQRAQLHPTLHVYVGNHCGVVCSYENYAVLAEVLEPLLPPKRPSLVPYNLSAYCFVEVTSSLLLCAHLLSTSASFFCSACFSGCKG